MKLGLMTAAFPGLASTGWPTWSADNGYEMIEVACWPSARGRQRRYAGVSHIDVAPSTPTASGDRLDDRARDLVARVLPQQPPPRSPPTGGGQHAPRRVIDAAAASACRSSAPSSAATRASRPRELQGVPQGLARSPRLRRRARESRSRSRTARCCSPTTSGPAGRTSRHAGGLGRDVLDLPRPNFGLNLDPSHLAWQMIDSEQVVRDYAARIVHVHAKDMEIDRDGLHRARGPLGGHGLADPRLPGLGEIDWGRFIGQLYRSATTASSPSSTRIAPSKGRRNSSSAASRSPATPPARTCTRCVRSAAPDMRGRGAALSPEADAPGRRPPRAGKRAAKPSCRPGRKLARPRSGARDEPEEGFVGNLVGSPARKGPRRPQARKNAACPRSSRPSGDATSFAPVASDSSVNARRARCRYRTEVEHGPGNRVVTSTPAGIGSPEVRGRLDDEKLETLRSWGAGLSSDSRDELRAAGKAILILIEEIEQLQVDVWHARHEGPGPTHDGLPARAGAGDAEDAASGLETTLRGRLGRSFGSLAGRRVALLSTPSPQVGKRRIPRWVLGRRIAHTCSHVPAA